MSEEGKYNPKLKFKTDKPFEGEVFPIGHPMRKMIDELWDKGFPEPTSEGEFKQFKTSIEPCAT